MDKQQATEQANRLLEWYGRPEDERWAGFTMVIGRYDTSEGKKAIAEWREQLIAQRPPCIINGMCFAFRSARIEEETPYSGKLVTEHVRNETVITNENPHVLVLSSNQGRYAIDEPDGTDLRSGMALTIKLGGMWIRGTVQHDRDGYYFEGSEGGCCGLCPGMRVRLA